jgi:hypothetical protein
MRATALDLIESLEAPAMCAAMSRVGRVRVQARFPSGSPARPSRRRCPPRPIGPCQEPADASSFRPLAVAARRDRGQAPVAQLDRAPDYGSGG